MKFPMKLIYEEKGVNSKLKVKITLEEHIKSIKHSEKIENDLVLAQEENAKNANEDGNEKNEEQEVTLVEKEIQEVELPLSSKKIPELILKSSVKSNAKSAVKFTDMEKEISPIKNEVQKSASGSKVIENVFENRNEYTPVLRNEKDKSSKKENVNEENPLKCSTIKKIENNNSPAMTGSKYKDNDLNNEERTKENIEVDPLRLSSVKKLKEQENIIN